MGVDVDAETAKGALLLSSERTHLVGGRFDADGMIQILPQRSTRRCAPDMPACGRPAI